MSNLDTDSLMEQALIPLSPEMNDNAVKFVVVMANKQEFDPDEILEMLGLHDEVEHVPS